MSDSEEINYEVERIVDKKIVYGNVRYYIKWKGFPKSSNTWEPAENLNCSKLVAMYEKKNAHKKLVWNPKPVRILDSQEIDNQVGKLLFANIYVHSSFYLCVCCLRVCDSNQALWYDGNSSTKKLDVSENCLWRRTKRSRRKTRISD